MNKFNIDERLKQYDLDQAKLMYALASDLLNEVADEDVLKLYEDNNDIFSKLSSKSKQEILSEPNLLKSAINVLVNHLVDQPLTREEYEEMDIAELMDYISALMEDKKLDLFDIIKYIEQK